MFAVKIRFHCFNQTRTRTVIDILTENSPSLEQKTSKTKIISSFLRDIMTFSLPRPDNSQRSRAARPIPAPHYFLEHGDSIARWRYKMEFNNKANSLVDPRQLRSPAQNSDCPNLADTSVPDVVSVFHYRSGTRCWFIAFAKPFIARRPRIYGDPDDLPKGKSVPNGNNTTV